MSRGAAAVDGRVISSRLTFLHKWLPTAGFLVILSALGIVAFANVAKSWTAENVAFLALWAGLGILAVLQYVYLFRPLADNVRDFGSYLTVRKRNVEQRIALSDIVRVDWSGSRAGVAILHLRTSGPLGSSIPFLPSVGAFGLNSSKIVTELRSRIEMAKRHPKGASTHIGQSP